MDLDDWMQAERELQEKSKNNEEGAKRSDETEHDF